MCLLIIIGVRETGSRSCWRSRTGTASRPRAGRACFRDLKRRELQRCSFRASGNVIDALPKRLQPRAKGLLHEISEAPTRADAKRALELFREEYGAKYPNAPPSSIATASR